MWKRKNSLFLRPPRRKNALPRAEQTRARGAGRALLGLLLLFAAPPAPARPLTYQQSGDGRGHWWRLRPTYTVAVLRPPPDATPLHYFGRGPGPPPSGRPLVLQLACRVGTQPLGAQAWIARHPHDLPAWRWGVFSGLWREATRALLPRPALAPVVIPVTVRISPGGAPHRAVVRRPREAYQRETDYTVALPVGPVVAALRAPRGGLGMVVQLVGQRAGAPWHVTAVYRLAGPGQQALAALLQACPPA